MNKCSKQECYKLGKEQHMRIHSSHRYTFLPPTKIPWGQGKGKEALFLKRFRICCLLLGRIYNCPVGQGIRGLQSPIRRCTKRCAVCGAASRKGERPRSHDLRLNRSGSSKHMEPDIGNNFWKVYKIGPCGNILGQGRSSLQPLISLDPFRTHIYCS